MILGITGGVGAGKSTVLAYLAQSYGAKVLELDRVAEKLQQPGGACYEDMLRLLRPYAAAAGREEDILLEDGKFDRKAVAALVFGDKKLLEQLNGIIHPAVREYVTDRVRSASPQELTVIESALLLDEERYDEMCDEIWYIYAPEEVRRERLRKSRGYSDDKITSIMNSQKSDAFFREHCEFIVDTSSNDVEIMYRQIDKGLSLHGIL